MSQVSAYIVVKAILQVSGEYGRYHEGRCCVYFVHYSTLLDVGWMKFGVTTSMSW